MCNLVFPPYKSRYPDHELKNTKLIPNLQAAVEAAYPSFQKNKYVNKIDLALYWAREVEKTEYIISIAKALGLVYFGRQTKQDQDLFTLGFTNTEDLELYLKQIAWEKIYSLSQGNTICLRRGYRADFIQTFWAELAAPSIYTQTLRKGLTLAYLEKQRVRQQKKLNDLLGDDTSAFDLITTNLS